MNGFLDPLFWGAWVVGLVGDFCWFAKVAKNSRDARIQGSVLAAIRIYQIDIIAAVAAHTGMCIVLYEMVHIAPILNYLLGWHLDPGATGWLNPGTGFLSGFFGQSMLFGVIGSRVEKAVGSDDLLKQQEEKKP